jgi:hypothetical protein
MNLGNRNVRQRWNGRQADRPPVDDGMDALRHREGVAGDQDDPAGQIFSRYQ